MKIRCLDLKQAKLILHKQRRVILVESEGILFLNKIFVAQRHLDLYFWIENVLCMFLQIMLMWYPHRCNCWDRSVMIEMLLLRY